MAIINPQTGQPFEENINPFSGQKVDPIFAKITQQDYANSIKPKQEMTPPPPPPPGTQKNSGFDNNGLGSTPEPTVKDVYGSDYSGAEKTYLDILNEQTKPVSQEDIRRQKMELFQGEIDALNKLYATKKADEQIAGQGRLGSSTAIQSRRGLLGSDFGAAQTEGVSTYNRQIQSAIDAEKGAKIGAILSKVREESVREFEAKTAARKQGAQDYINYLSGAEERKTKKVTEAVSDALYNGVEDNEFFNELANSLGVPVSKVKAEYNRQKAAKDKANEKDVMTVAPGSSIYDKSGKFIGTAPEKPADNKPITQEVGDTLLQWDAATNSWKSIYTAPKETDPIKKITFNGVDYIQNSDGTLSPAPKPRDAQATTQAQEKSNLIQTLLDDPNLSTITGAKGITNYLPGTAAQLTKNNLNQLINDLILDERGRLKGSGAISDFETKIIRQAASPLGTNLKNEDMVKVLKDIKQKFDNVLIVDQMIKEMGITEQEAYEAIGESFNNPLSMGQNGSNTSQVPQVSDVSGIKDFSRVNTLMGAGVVTGITNGSSAWKYGLDLVLDGGQKAPVKTPFGGEVILANADGGFGNSVKVRLDNGEVIRLSHLKSINVKKGQRIPAGSIIGIQGNTGTTIKVGKNGTGTHVDVTIYDKSGKPYSSQQVASRINTKLS